MRPAHLHFIVAADGYKALATQFFDAEDPHAFDDVVFGAVGYSKIHNETNAFMDFAINDTTPATGSSPSVIAVGLRATW